MQTDIRFSNETRNLQFQINKSKYVYGETKQFNANIFFHNATNIYLFYTWILVFSGFTVLKWKQCALVDKLQDFCATDTG